MIDTVDGYNLDILSYLNETTPMSWYAKGRLPNHLEEHPSFTFIKFQEPSFGVDPSDDMFARLLPNPHMFGYVSRSSQRNSSTLWGWSQHPTNYLRCIEKTVNLQTKTTLQGTNISHLGKKENHLQKCRGYVYPTRVYRYTYHYWLDRFLNIPTNIFTTLENQGTWKYHLQTGETSIIYAYLCYPTENFWVLVFGSVSCSIAVSGSLNRW